MERSYGDNRRWHARKPQQFNKISSTTVAKRQYKVHTCEPKTVENLNKEIAKLKAIIYNSQRQLDKALRDREILWHS